MRKWLNYLTSDRIVAAVFLVIAAIGSGVLAVGSNQPLLWALCGLCGVVALGLLAKHRWAEIAAIALFAMTALGKVFRLISEGWSWRQAVYGAVAAWIAYDLWKSPDEGMFSEEADDESDDQKDSEPIISLVHLRSSQRYLEPVVLANALSGAWGVRIAGPEDDPDQADGFVAGDNPLFIVMLQKPSFAMFMVHNHDSTYFDEPEKVADRMPNLRFADIIRDHSSWLAVDLMRVGANEVDEASAYRMIGKAVAALADSDVMAILCPQHEYFNLWSDELESMLCSDAPLEALLKEVKAPVYGVPEGGTIGNAIAEARRRWPEFVDAFKARAPDDDRFLVKAPFTGEDEQVEHMWMQVFGLEPEYVHGHLVNDPIHTTRLQKGSQVEVPVADVSDWICPDAQGQPLGNFTHHAVVAAANATAERDSSA